MSTKNKLAPTTNNDKYIALLNEMLNTVKSRDPMTAIKIEDTIKSYQEGLSIDHDLIEHLRDLSAVDGTQLVQKHEYNKLMEFMDENSIVIYFNSAKTFKVYKTSQIKSDLHNHLNNNFRSKKNMYEVVPDNVPQKILILCDKDVIEHIDAIKNYVIEFMATKGAEIKKSDIKAFKSESEMIEIMINGYYVSNYKESAAFISDLMKYIERREQNAEITNKMNPRVFNEYDGIHMVATPNNKVSVSGERLELVDMLVRNLAKCKDMTGKNVYIMVGETNIIGNNNNTTVTKSTKTTIINNDVEDADSFIDYLKNNKPEWFDPGSFVDKSFIQAKYEELYGEISKVKFHNLFNGKIFGKSKRETKENVRTLKVQLLDYADMP